MKQAARLMLGLGLAALPACGIAQAQPAEARWQMIEQCPGQRGRSYVLTSDGTTLTARLSGTALDSFGTILGFTPILPGGRFALDIAIGGTDAKATYTGRIRPDGTLSAEGGVWAGSDFTPCQARVTRLGASAARPGPAGPPPGGAVAGRPEPIAPSRSTAAGRPEPIPAPQAAPRAVPPAAVAPGPSASLPPCEEPGPAPSALAPDGTWRSTCVPRAATARPAAPPPAPVPPPAAQPMPAPAPGPAAQSETERLRQQVEEERRRREAAERALRLNDALGRQGRN